MLRGKGTQFVCTFVEEIAHNKPRLAPLKLEKLK